MQQCRPGSASQEPAERMETEEGRTGPGPGSSAESFVGTPGPGWEGLGADGEASPAHGFDALAERGSAEVRVETWTVVWEETVGCTGCWHEALSGTRLQSLSGRGVQRSEEATDTPLGHNIFGGVGGEEEEDDGGGDVNDACVVDVPFVCGFLVG